MGFVNTHTPVTVPQSTAIIATTIPAVAGTTTDVGGDPGTLTGGVPGGRGADIWRLRGKRGGEMPVLTGNDAQQSRDLSLRMRVSAANEEASGAARALRRVADVWQNRGRADYSNLQVAGEANYTPGVSGYRANSQINRVFSSQMAAVGLNATEDPQDIANQILAAARTQLQATQISPEVVDVTQQPASISVAAPATGGTGGGLPVVAIIIGAVVIVGGYMLIKKRMG